MLSSQSRMLSTTDTGAAGCRLKRWVVSKCCGVRAVTTAKSTKYLTCHKNCPIAKAYRQKHGKNFKPEWRPALEHECCAFELPLQKPYTVIARCCDATKKRSSKHRKNVRLMCGCPLAGSAIHNNWDPLLIQLPMHGLRLASHRQHGGGDHRDHDSICALTRGDKVCLACRLTLVCAGWTVRACGT